MDVQKRFKGFRDQSRLEWGMNLDRDVFDVHRLGDDHIKLGAILRIADSLESAYGPRGANYGLPAEVRKMRRYFYGLKSEIKKLKSEIDELKKRIPNEDSPERKGTEVPADTSHPGETTCVSSDL